MNARNDHQMISTSIFKPDNEMNNFIKKKFLPGNFFDHFVRKYEGTLNNFNNKAFSLLNDQQEKIDYQAE